MSERLEGEFEIADTKVAWNKSEARVIWIVAGRESSEEAEMAGMLEAACLSSLQ